MKAEDLAKDYAEKFILTVDHQGDVEEAYIDGYNQAEKDLTDKARLSSGWDGFYYGQGYKQAEEDLKLTWEDIALIETISKEFIKNNTTPMTDKDYYQEVLKRFNKERKK